MLRPRIIPTLLLQDNRLIKTVNFSNPKYIGDPINAVKIFNEKAVDELAIFDISATASGREPNFELIERIAQVCRMPLCYGGGVSEVEDFERLVSIGVEKVAVSTVAMSQKDVFAEAVRRVGSQSVVAVLDVRKDKKLDQYDVFLNNGKDLVGIEVKEAARMLCDMGAGEIVLNSIDRDGTGRGFDLDLMSQIFETTTVPISLIGGANSHLDIVEAVERFGPVGLGAGTMFVMQGKFKAVLIRYLTEDQRLSIAHASHNSKVMLNEND